MLDIDLCALVLVKDTTRCLAWDGAEGERSCPRTMVLGMLWDWEVVVIAGRFDNELGSGHCILKQFSEVPLYRSEVVVDLRACLSQEVDVLDTLLIRQEYQDRSLGVGQFSHKDEMAGGLAKRMKANKFENI